MNFWDKITGNDMTREWKVFEARVKNLPPDYQEAWEKIADSISLYSDFTGRNLTPIFDSMIHFMEEMAADGQTARDTFGNDIAGFCEALAGESGAKNYRDKWRDELNRNVAKKLGGLQ